MAPISAKDAGPARARISQAYEKKVLRWRAQNEAGLRAENGWLALAGLFWLKQGKNRVGSDPASDIRLPARAPRQAGSFQLTGSRVQWTAARGVSVRVNGRTAAPASLKPSRASKPSFLSLDDLRMVVHEYAGQVAIRLWDNRRPERTKLPPLKWFPIDARYRLRARYTRYAKPRKVQQPDVFGDIVDGRMDGYLTFEFEKQSCRLEVAETGDHRLFVQFRDLTSGRETYGSSRYYYTEKLKDDKLTLDFNFSYSPPCAFTEFATCVFAPPQNHLPFRVEAGEMYTGHA